MKYFKNALVAILGAVLLCVTVSYAATQTALEELTVDITNVTAQTYGTKAYSTFYNESDSGRGKIYGVFQIYFGYYWYECENAIVYEGHFKETHLYDPNDSLVYNFRGTISTIYNANNPAEYEYLLREGYVAVTATLP